MAIFQIAIVLVIATVCLGQKIEGKVFLSYHMDQIHEDQTLKVTLNYGQYETYTQKNGIFVLQSNTLQSYNIPYGRYYLEVHSRNFLYEAAFIDVYSKGSGVTKISPVTRKRPTIQHENSKIQSVKDQMVFQAIQKIEYFEKDDDFNLASLFSNQFAIMGAITVGLLILLKKLPMEQMQQAARESVTQ